MRLYNSVEHESLRAVVRCLAVNFGWGEAFLRATQVKLFFGVAEFAELTPFGAHTVRKTLERALPIRGDFA